MGHAVAGVVTHVEDQAVTPLGQSFGGRDLVGQGEHVAQNLLVFGPKRGSIVDMAPGDDEDVGGSDRVQVPERDGLVGRSHLFRGDIAVDDAAKDAVGHIDSNVLGDDATARFLADARNIESARARAREHWIRQQAREAATFGGILRALSERKGTVEVVTVDGGRAVGRILSVSPELIELGSEPPPNAWVVAGGVARVSPLSDSRDAGVASDDRGTTSSTTLMGVLGDLADDRANLTIRCGGTEVAGRIAGLGADVLTVRGPSGELSYLPVDRLTVVRLG